MAAQTAWAYKTEYLVQQEFRHFYQSIRSMYLGPAELSMAPTEVIDVVLYPSPPYYSQVVHVKGVLLLGELRPPHYNFGLRPRHSILKAIYYDKGASFIDPSQFLNTILKIFHCYKSSILYLQLQLMSQCFWRCIALTERQM